MTCILEFQYYREGEGFTSEQIPFESTHFQQALADGKVVYGKRAEEGFDPLCTQRAHVVFGTRRIPLHLHPRQITQFSIQM